MSLLLWSVYASNVTNWLIVDPPRDGTPPPKTAGRGFSYLWPCAGKSCDCKKIMDPEMGNPVNQLHQCLIPRYLCLGKAPALARIQPSQLHTAHLKFARRLTLLK